jgi:anti-sigma factor RsiW
VLVAFLDGELKASTEQAVRRHLARCPSCRARAGQLAQTWDRLGGATPPRAEPGFTERMMARIAEEKELAALEARLRFHRRLRRVGTTVAGLAAGLVLGLALYAWSGLLEEPNSPVEQEVSRNVAFLEDVDLLDEMAVVEALDDMTDVPLPDDGA